MVKLAALLLTVLLPFCVVGESLIDLDEILNDCGMECIEDVEDRLQPILDSESIHRYDARSTQKFCEIRESAAECIQKCRPLVNPLGTHGMAYICSDDYLEGVKEHRACFRAQQKKVAAHCNSKCTPIDEKFSIYNTAKNNRLCGDLKCHTLCSVETYEKLCRKRDPEAGEFLKISTEKALDANHRDYVEMGGSEGILRFSMPKCAFLYGYDPLFD